MQVHSTWQCRQGLRLLHVSIAVLCLCTNSLAQAVPPAALSDEALEERFWDCDALSTVAALPSDEGVQCVLWTDELKQRRFDGDFVRMLDWWREHKAEQHARRLEPSEPD